MRRKGSAWHGGPDWVVLGTPTSDGKVSVYASRDLTEAELRQEVDDIVWGQFGPRTYLPRRIELVVGMRTAVVVTANTYEQAFRVLFDQWSPDGEVLAIGDGRRQIAEHATPTAGGSGVSKTRGGDR